MPGKNLVYRLLAASTPVTVIDKIFYQDELDEIYEELPQARSLLQVTNGDVRDASIMRKVMTPDVTGVIHLAGVARMDRCEKNEVDCFDVNERGTEAVLESILSLNQGDKGSRWLVLASSAEVYGNTEGRSVIETSQREPRNAYGESFLRAENAVTRILDTVKDDSGFDSLHVISLRLATVYGGGFDDLARLVPSVVTQALTHQVVQIDQADEKLDLLHMEDTVDAFMLAVSRLSQLRRGLPLKRKRTSFDAFNIGSGNVTSVEAVLDKVLRLTDSKSPIRRIPKTNKFPPNSEMSIKKAQNTLGFKASIGLDQGLLKLVKLYLERNERALRRIIDSKCGASSPTIKTNAISEMHKLNNCQSHVHVHVQGELAVLGTPRDGKDDGRWHVESKFPPDVLRTFIKNGPDGKPLLSISDEHGWLMVIERLPTLPTQGPVGMKKMVRENLSSHHFEWEMDVNAEQGTMKLGLPGTSLQLRPPISEGGDFHLVSRDLDIWPFRVTPVCCEAPPPWPFFGDDRKYYTIYRVLVLEGRPNTYLSATVFQTEYQRSSKENPWLASGPKTLCYRLSKAQRRVLRDIAALSRGMLHNPRREETSSQHLWSNTDLPACSNSCDVPLVCIDTGDCQCVLSSCPIRERSPFSYNANPSALSYPPPALGSSASVGSSSNPLVDMVQQSSWLDVIRPQATRFIEAKLPLPKVRIGDLRPKDIRWKQELGASLTHLRDEGCFSADTSLESAIASMNVTKEEADYTTIPYYQGRTSYTFEQLFGTYHYNRDTNPYFDPERVIMTPTTDWGMCSVFQWNVWNFRKALDTKLDKYARLTMWWHVIGDLNSPCHRPHYDVVIPPRSCHSPDMIASFDEMAKVRPTRDRSILLSWAGSLWGTGVIARRKLMCSRPDGEHFDHLPKRKLTTNQKLLRTSLGMFTKRQKYMDLINDSIFCPQPAGTTGWSTRLTDTMFGGCIPVFIGDTAYRPFYDIIDWSKVSVQISSGEINRIEEILLTRYSLEDVERMQVNIMLIRDALIYPLDDASEDQVQERMLSRRGPLWYALQSTKMRMLTKWPREDVYDRP
ncbi:hypothetical protein FRB90_007584 [Tulasnella sp. 427]|nr:hypothetical protein FRB90_007584 [Tulasnella sp. 427]